jgi:CRP/FNR family cyclic AMP-dependent transcriptional regulator
MSESLIKTNAKSYKKDETIFKEGDIGEEMYIIKSGRVEVVRNVQGEEMVLATLEANSFFGEMALFGDKHRSATIRAVDDTSTIQINRSILDLQLSKAPDWFVAIMRTLVLRLKETNKRIQSRYYINLDYSLIKMILLVMNVIGTRKDSELSADFRPVIKDLRLILGVSQAEVVNKLKDFTFIHLIKYSIDDNTITMPDVEKTNEFLLFLQGKKDNKTRLTSKFEDLQKDTKKMQYYERLYQLLSRGK